MDHSREYFEKEEKKSQRKRIYAKNYHFNKESNNPLYREKKKENVKNYRFKKMMGIETRQYVKREKVKTIFSVPYERSYGKIHLKGEKDKSLEGYFRRYNLRANSILYLLSVNPKYQIRKEIKKRFPNIFEKVRYKFFTIFSVFYKVDPIFHTENVISQCEFFINFICFSLFLPITPSEDGYLEDLERKLSLIIENI